MSDYPYSSQTRPWPQAGELPAWGIDRLRTSSDVARPRFGLLYVVLTPVAASVSNLHGLSVGGLNYTGILWMVLFVSGMFLLMLEKALRPQHVIRFPVAAWVPWLTILFASLAWCKPLARINVQDVLQIAMPLLVGVLASLFVRRRIDFLRLVGGCKWGLAILCLSVVADAAGLFAGLGLVFEPRTMSLTAVLLACLFVTAYPPDARSAMAPWLICLALTVATGSRMASGAMLMLPMLHPLFRSRWQKPAIALTLVAMTIGVFFVPTIQERFFGDEQGAAAGEMPDAEAIGTGRFKAWPLILEEALKRPWLGHGAGSTTLFVPTVWPTMFHPHNDFLRVGFETGLIGLAIFVLTVFWQTWHALTRIKVSQGDTRRLFAAAYLGFCAFLLTACSDNPLVYNLWYMNPLFALLGAAYGMAGEKHPDNGPAPVARPASRPLMSTRIQELPR